MLHYSRLNRFGIQSNVIVTAGLFTVAAVNRSLSPCVRIDVASFKETLLAYRGRNEENDDNLSRRIQSQDHCADAAAA